MPLITLKYSNNLNALEELKGFLSTANSITATTVKTDLKHCKASLAPQAHYCIGNGEDPMDSFIVLTIELMVGRTHDVKSTLSKELLSALTSTLTSISPLSVPLEKCQISCHIKDLDPHHYEKAIL